MNKQTPGQEHKFPCGCIGTLPAERGAHNSFVKWVNKKDSCWRCRRHRNGLSRPSTPRHPRLKIRPPFHRVEIDTLVFTPLGRQPFLVRE